MKRHFTTPLLEKSGELFVEIRWRQMHSIKIGNLTLPSVEYFLDRIPRKEYGRREPNENKMASTISSLFCSKCGTQNASDSLFCAKCGSHLVHPVNAGQESASIESRPLQSQTATSQPAPRPNAGFLPQSGPAELPIASTAMTQGILAVVTSFFPLAGIPLGILAIINSNKARKLIEQEPTQYAPSSKVTAGFVCGIVGLSLSGIFTLAYMSGDF